MPETVITKEPCYGNDTGSPHPDPPTDSVCARMDEHDVEHDTGRRAGWRQFRTYWFGHVASFTGEWFTNLALPYAALSINDSPFFIGVIESAELISTLVVGLYLGHLADRMSPRRVLITSDLVRSAALLTVALSFAFGAPPALLLVAVAFVLGAMRDFHDSGEGVMMVSVVDERDLVRANGWFQISDGFGHMTGSLLAGVAASIGLVVAFAVDATSYALAAVAVVAMGRVQVNRSESGVADGPTEGPPEAATSWRVVATALRRDNRYWRVLTTMALTNVASACFMGQFVNFADLELGISQWQVGLTWSVMGAGSFLAGLWLDRARNITPRSILAAPAVMGGGLIAVGQSHSWVVTLIVFGAVGFVLAWGAALIAAMRHASFPAEIQGRVAMVTRLAFAMGIIPAVLGAGALASTIGSSRTFIAFGTLAAVGLLLGLFLRVTDFESLTRPQTTQ